ncbi:MAG: SCO family protein [Opitutaceae bacterium]|nr:SCO family protein [Opitutaceae bacterium]
MKTHAFTCLLLATALTASGDDNKPCCPPEPPKAEAVPAAYSPESLYQIGVTFTDDEGRSVALGTLRGRPVVIAMFFASCHYACPLLVADMTRIRDGLPPAERERVALVLVSFDTVRDTPEALRRYRAERLLDGQWTLLHGDDDAVREIAALLGVKYRQETDGQFAHSNLITVLNAEGEIVHRRAGLRGGLEEAAAALAITLRAP